ncbi:hypothetical protein [Paenibacillus sp. FSL R7-0179]
MVPIVTLNQHLEGDIEDIEKMIVEMVAREECSCTGNGCGGDACGIK